MKILRSISLGLLTASLLSFLVAYECYQRTLKNAQRIADQLEIFQIEQVSTPMATYVGFTMGVMFLVASIRCYWNYRTSLHADKNHELIPGPSKS